MRDKLISIIPWAPPQGTGSLSVCRGIAVALLLLAVYEAQSQLSTCLFICTFQAFVSGMLFAICGSDLWLLFSEVEVFLLS